MHLAFTIGLIHHLLALSSNYLELKSSSPEFLAPPFHRIVFPDKCFANMSFCEIPVRLPKTDTQIMTCVSPQDYETMKKLAPVWRMNNRGYVITSRRREGKYRLIYMHKEIAGEACRHLNGDRLDNRRENLIPARPRRPFIELSPLDLKNVHPLLDHVETLDNTISRDSSGKYSTIRYNDKKVYSGETHNGIPHGLGTLVERDRSSFGWFLYGQFKSGCVLDHPSTADRVRYLYEQECIKPIKNAFVVRVNGKHERLW